MAKGRTIRESISGCPPGAEALVAIWNEGLVDNMLRLVWKAYDQLSKEFFAKLNWNEDYDDLERSINEEFEREIHRNMDCFMPISVRHGPFERESRSITKRNAQPPQYDIAFSWNSDPRLMWPLEAKVIKSDSNTVTNLGDYIEAVNNRYLTCKYAPLSNSGAMMGYLKTGDAEVVAKNIAKRLNCCLKPNKKFTGRCHRISNHKRSVPSGKDYPSKFCCHHLIMLLDRANRTSAIGK